MFDIIEKRADSTYRYQTQESIGPGNSIVIIIIIIKKNSFNDNNNNNA